ncbi:MAG: FxLYD domain-containing protein [Propionibacteriaceae bacterium]|jgi:hypothetical protein|nr:FxLYD domain-containing protein [Propionibacteriaceae bacterium]
MLTRPPARIRALALAAGIGLGALVMAGCQTTLGQPEASETPVTVIGPGSDIANNLDARADVAITTCEPTGEDGEYKVEASVTNTTDDTVTYEMALRLADASNGNVVAREALTTDPVGPGEETTVETTLALEEPADEVNCVFVAIDRVEA